jgi:four helix bundle protein
MAIERNESMQAELSHERLDVYRVYLEVANLCGDIVSSVARPIAVFDHLDRAMESIGVNFMRANVQAPGSAQRAAYLDVSIASANECAASLDVCSANRAIDESACTASMGRLWRIRGMLLGLKRVSVNRVREDSMPYGNPQFPFMELDMYSVSLESVRWAHDLSEALAPKARVRRKLDVSTTGTVLNIAEGHGRESVADQNRFMKTAQEHAFQTLLLLDLMVARGETTKSRVIDGKATQARVISMLHGWCARNEERNGPQE